MQRSESGLGAGDGGLVSGERRGGAVSEGGIGGSEEGGRRKGRRRRKGEGEGRRKENGRRGFEEARRTGCRVDRLMVVVFAWTRQVFLGGTVILVENLNLDLSCLY